MMKKKTKKIEEVSPLRVVVVMVITCISYRFRNGNNLPSSSLLFLFLSITTQSLIPPRQQ